MKTLTGKWLKIGLFGLIVTGLALAAGLFYWRQPRNPVPANIKSQYSFKTVYPAQISTIQPTSYQYQSDQQSLTFNINYAGQKVVFTEQTAPGSLGSSDQVYYPALGLHPYAQFATKLGPVALAKFWQSGTLKPAGQSAILDTAGTLLIAHTDQSLTNEQWKDLINSLNVSK